LHEAISKVKWGALDTGGPRHLYRERLMVGSLLGNLDSGRVLDAGCGNGTLTAKLARFGFEAYGLELSQAQLVLAQQRATELSLEHRIGMIQGDVTQLPFPDVWFDAVVCGEVLEHVENDASAVMEFRRVLKSGGICVVTVPANPRLWGIDDEWVGHVRRYQKRELLDLFESNGFRVKRIRYWGFLFLRIYRQIVSWLWIRRAINKEPQVLQKDMMTRVGVNNKVSLLLAHVFNIDNLFSNLPWGIGFLLEAEKT